MGNHDNPRISDRFGAHKVDIVNILLAALPGATVTYYVRFFLLISFKLKTFKLHREKNLECTTCIPSVQKYHATIVMANELPCNGIAHFLEDSHQVRRPGYPWLMTTKYTMSTTQEEQLGVA